MPAILEPEPVLYGLLWLIIVYVLLFALIFIWKLIQIPAALHKEQQARIDETSKHTAKLEVRLLQAAPYVYKTRVYSRYRIGIYNHGPARAAKMSPEERSESARKAAQARWQKRTEREG